MTGASVGSFARCGRWYRRHGRTLPWRGESDPYRIILSEIMLQQTQVSRVLVQYGRFLRRFPSMRALARAPRRDVILAWRGMGYNNRAVRLHALASVLVARGMNIPRAADELLELPGIGKYTAHAILSSVHGLPVPDCRREHAAASLARLLADANDGGDEERERDLARRRESPSPPGRVRLEPVADGHRGHGLLPRGAPCARRVPSAEVCASCARMRQEHREKGKSEPGFPGVPNRIYRGRIVEALREEAAGRTAGALGKVIHPEFTPRDSRGLRG